MSVPDIGDSFLHYTIISVMLVPIIYTTVLIKQKKASYFSCVVFLSIVVNHLMDENPFLFVLNRSLDTLIGIFVGLFLNSIRIHGKLDKSTLFVADLDRTMDGFSGGLTPFSQVSIKNMLEEGINLTFMTMRTPAGFLEGMPEVRLKLPVIAMNGAILYDCKENRYPRVYAMYQAALSKAPLIGLQKVTDNLVAFWGMADDDIDESQIRNMIKVGKLVERIDLYARLKEPAEKIRREARRLINRIDKSTMRYKPKTLAHVNYLVPIAKKANMDLIWVHGASTVLESTLAYSLNSRGTNTLVVEMGVGMRITPEHIYL